MSIRKLPQILNLQEPAGCDWQPSIDAVERWTPGLRIANSAGDDDTVIEIFDQIGKDPWTGEGIDAADVSKMLAGAKNVVVNMNSPGGNFFQGAAIFNLLNSHAGKVIVNVIGLAASAASFILCAADEVYMGPASFVMIHNAHAIAVGDRHDMQNTLDTLASIDASIRDVYVNHTGKHAAKIAQMMDDETWLNARDAIANKFATGMIQGKIAEDAEVTAYAHPMAQRRELDAILADAGKTRSQRRALIAGVKGAAAPIEQRADTSTEGLRDELRALAATVNGTSRAADPSTMRDAGFPGVQDSLARLAAKLGG